VTAAAVRLAKTTITVEGIGLYIAITTQNEWKLQPGLGAVKPYSILVVRLIWLT